MCLSPRIIGQGGLRDDRKWTNSDLHRCEMMHWSLQSIQCNEYDHATVVEHDCTHSTEWMVDSSMSSHICVNQNWFTSYSSLNPPHLIILGDKHTVYTISQGQIDISIDHGPDNWHATVQDVLHCPDIGSNLLSISHLTNVNLEVWFIKNYCLLLNSNEDWIGVTPWLNGLSRLPCTVMGAESAYITKYIGNNMGNVKVAQVMHTTTVSASVDVWHCQLGHISIDSILKMSWSGMAKGMDMIGNRSDGSTYCEECEASGHTWSVIPKETLTHLNEVLGHIFSDICEVQMITCEGYQYFITFIDDHS